MLQVELNYPYVLIWLIGRWAGEGGRAGRIEHTFRYVPNKLPKDSGKGHPRAAAVEL